MLGCDYTDSIRGIGPKRAIDLITQHKSLEDILKNIDAKKYAPPENWNFEGARQLFIEPEIMDPQTIDVSVRCTSYLLNPKPFYRQVLDYFGITLCC